MKIPVVRGVIERRILANYRIDPQFMATLLPAPFRPQLVNGFAIGGICLIRLKQIRPRFLPMPWGLQSENAAHRIAVEWDSNGQVMNGVFIPRRDTNSRLNSLAGGKIFPGLHHHADFSINERDNLFDIYMKSDDGETSVKVSGVISDNIPDNSVFTSLKSASDFFEKGSLGYSVTSSKDKYDGLELKCGNWDACALDIKEIKSSFFDDASKFPPGSIDFDCALLMKNISHEWHGKPELCS